MPTPEKAITDFQKNPLDKLNDLRPEKMDSLMWLLNNFEFLQEFLEERVREGKYLKGWRDFYHPIATVEEVDNTPLDEMGRKTPLEVTLLKKRLVVARLDGEITVSNGTCPHRSASLGVGWVSEDKCCLTCRYHGAEFDKTAKITDFPAITFEGHKVPDNEKWRTNTFQTVVRGGLVWASLSDNPKFPVIDIPEENDPNFVMMPISSQEWKAGIGRMIEAGLDNYHFAYTHQSTGLGSPENPSAPKVEFMDADGALMHFRYVIDQPVNITTSSADRIDQGGFEPVSYEMTVMPNAVRLLKTSSIGRYVIVVGVHPIEPKRSIFYRLLYRDFRTDEPHDEWFDKENDINAEDQLVVETMRPEELTIDLDAELQIYVDRPTVQYRQLCEELGLEFF